MIEDSKNLWSGYEITAFHPPKASIRPPVEDEAAVEPKSHPSPKPWIPITAATAIGTRIKVFDLAPETEFCPLSNFESGTPKWSIMANAAIPARNTAIIAKCAAPPKEENG